MQGGAGQGEVGWGMAGWGMAGWGGAGRVKWGGAWQGGAVRGGAGQGDVGWGMAGWGMAGWGGAGQVRAWQDGTGWDVVRQGLEAASLLLMFTGQFLSQFPDCTIYVLDREHTASVSLSFKFVGIVLVAQLYPVRYLFLGQDGETHTMESEILLLLCGRQLE